MGGMALRGMDSSVGHSFSLEIEGVQIAVIAEVSGLALEQEVIETKETTADGTVVIRKLPGRPKAGEMTLTRGLAADQSFENWVKALRSDPTTARKTGSIIVFNSDGAPAAPLPAGACLAEEPGNRHAQGRRHLRPHREADAYLRAARARVISRSSRA